MFQAGKWHIKYQNDTVFHNNTPFFTILQRESESQKQQTQQHRIVDWSYVTAIYIQNFQNIVKNSKIKIKFKKLKKPKIAINRFRRLEMTKRVKRAKKITCEWVTMKDDFRDLQKLMKAASDCWWDEEAVFDLGKVVT